MSHSIAITHHQIRTLSPCSHTPPSHSCSPTQVSERYQPPFFITVYGGLNWEPGSTGGKTEFWALLHATMADLGSGFVAVGASEMARLAKTACNVSGGGGNATQTCDVSAEQRDCSPNGQPWRNSSEAACRALGCCWHHGGVRPTGHWCIHPEAPPPTCLKPKALVD